MKAPTILKYVVFCVLAFIGGATVAFVTDLIIAQWLHEEEQLPSTYILSFGDNFSGTTYLTPDGRLVDLTSNQIVSVRLHGLERLKVKRALDNPELLSLPPELVQQPGGYCIEDAVSYTFRIQGKEKDIYLGCGTPASVKEVQSALKTPMQRLERLEQKRDLR